MSVSLPLVTMAELRAFIGMNPQGTAENDALMSVAKVATADLEKYTGRLFTRQEITEYFTSRNATVADLDVYGESYDGVVIRANIQQLPLKGVNVDPDEEFAVYYDPQLKYPETSRLIPDRDYVVDYEAGRVVIKTTTRYNIRALKVVYTAGYEANEGSLSADAPEALKMACLIQAQHLRVRNRPDNIGVEVDRSFNGAQSKVAPSKFMVRGGLTPEAAALVRHLKRLRTGKG